MLKLTSSAFAQNGDIPAKHTCDGPDTQPPLEWSGAPAGTRSFAMIVDDPDAPDPAAPKMVYVHWVLYDIPASTTSLAEGRHAIPSGAREGKNDWHKVGYNGPCPPIGRHRYFFKLYALDNTLGDLGSPTKPELLKAMEGHILENAELMGGYRRPEGSKG